ncbi:MAG: LLM class F420-dependent oxidoreductase [Acetobacteraceae bacterium]|nr:LLM class F420-dependent oxidoreductase [Acetobacteraceae bacterium]
MRYGFYLPTRGALASRAAIAALARAGESAGFHSAMVADHVVFPVTSRSAYPYTVSGEHPSHGDALEQAAMLAFVAGITERLRLVSSVMILPYRNPVLAAKMLATIDVLSEGRLTVGVGVGWLEEEFAALGAPDFRRRGAVTDEYLRIFRTLWTQSPASHAGEFYAFQDIRCEPLPVQRPGPPIWVGGHSAAALRRTARYGDGWHPVGAIAAVPLPPAEMRAKLAELRRLTGAEGRDFDALTISYKAPLYDVALPGPDGGRRPFSGEAGAIVEDIHEFAAIGVHELIFDFRGETLGESLARLERFAREVMPRVG